MGIEWWLGMVLYVVVTIPWKRFQSSSIVHSIAKPTLPDDIYSFSATRWRIRNQKWLGLPSACSKQFPPSYQPIELALVFARFPFHDKLEVPPPLHDLYRIWSINPKKDRSNQMLMRQHEINVTATRFVCKMCDVNWLDQRFYSDTRVPGMWSVVYGDITGVCFFGR